MIHFCNRTNLVDIWRQRNPAEQQYTWSNKKFTLSSRIDFWLISRDMEGLVTEVLISPTIMSDHRSILLKTNLAAQDNKRNLTNWKLNNSLLSHNDFTKSVKELFERYWNSANADENNRRYWELLKYEIRKYAIRFGKELVRKKRAKIEHLTKSISDMTLNLLNDIELMPELNKLQQELDEL